MGRMMNRLFENRPAATLVLLVVGHIPIWFFLIARWLFEPVGYWQELALAGIGLWYLGGIQIILWIGLVVCLKALWERRP